MRRIDLIEPTGSPLLPESVVEQLGRDLGADATLHHAHNPTGPTSVETFDQEAAAVPGVVELVRSAEVRGSDVAVIGCVADVAVTEARRVATIPVVGLGQAALELAALRAGRTLVMVATEDGVASMSTLYRRVLPDAGPPLVAPLGVPIRSLVNYEPSAVDAFVETCRAVARVEPLSSVIIGCSAAGGMREAIVSRFTRQSIDIEVIDPLAWGMRLAAAIPLRTEGNQLPVKRGRA